jgi:hypothetical protein
MASECIITLVRQRGRSHAAAVAVVAAAVQAAAHALRKHGGGAERQCARVTRHLHAVSAAAGTAVEGRAEGRGRERVGRVPGQNVTKYTEGSMGRVRRRDHGRLSRCCCCSRRCRRRAGGGGGRGHRRGLVRGRNACNKSRHARAGRGWAAAGGAMSHRAALTRAFPGLRRRLQRRHAEWQGSGVVVGMCIS